MKKRVAITFGILLFFNFAFAKDINLLNENDTILNKQDNNLKQKTEIAKEQAIAKKNVSTNKNKDVFLRPLDSLKILNDSINKLIKYDSASRVEIQTLNNEINKLNSEIELKDKNSRNRISIFYFYSLIAILIILIFIFINAKVHANQKYTKRQEQLRKSQTDLNQSKSEIETLTFKVKQLIDENDKIKNENQQYRTEIYQRQQKLIENVSVSQTILEKNTTEVDSPKFASFYADAIIDGKFNRVKEQPDDDTIFELKVNDTSDKNASVVIYEFAHKRVIANPSFLEGCEKQILGNSIVTMLREGKAAKDGNGKWILTLTPEVKIS